MIKPILMAAVGLVVAKPFQYKTLSGDFDQSTNCGKFTTYLASKPLDSSIHRESGFWRDDSLGTARTGDYTNSGYQRGHLSPAEALSFDSLSMHESFSMVNICPQTAKMNASVIRRIENAVADSVVKYGGGRIWTGPLFKKVLGTFGKTTKVQVPSHYFKVFCSPRNACTAWLVANNEDITQGPVVSRSTLATITKYTGLKFKFFP